MDSAGGSTSVCIIQIGRKTIRELQAANRSQCSILAGAQQIGAQTAETVLDTQRKAFELEKDAFVTPR